MQFKLIIALLTGSLAASAATAQPTATAQPVVAGWIERITLPEKGLVFEAKLDTGADSSSLNGHKIERFRRAGGSFVRFEMSDDTGKSIAVEAPVVRRVRIKRSGSDDDSRAVVRLKVCVGGMIAEGDFTVADRGELSYQVLIGRNLLAGRILVDSSQQRVVSDRCPLPR